MLLQTNCWELDISRAVVYVHDINPVSLTGPDGKVISKANKAVLKHVKYVLKE